MPTTSAELHATTAAHTQFRRSNKPRPRSPYTRCTLSFGLSAVIRSPYSLHSHFARGQRVVSLQVHRGMCKVVKSNSAVQVFGDGLCSCSVLWVSTCTSPSHPRRMTSSALLMSHSLSQPCLLYTSPSPRDRTRSRMPSSA